MKIIIRLLLARYLGYGQFESSILIMQSFLNKFYICHLTKHFHMKRNLLFLLGATLLFLAGCAPSGSDDTGTPSTNTTTTETEPVKALKAYFKFNADNEGQKTYCGFESLEGAQEIPDGLVQKYRLLRSNFDPGFEFIPQSNIKVKGVSQQRHLDHDIFIYLLHGQVQDLSESVEVRCVLYNNTGQLGSNFLVAGYQEEEGENSLCGKMWFTQEGIRYDVDTIVNFPDNIIQKDGFDILFFDD